MPARVTKQSHGWTISGEYPELTFKFNVAPDGHVLSSKVDVTQTVATPEPPKPARDLTLPGDLLSWCIEQATGESSESCGGCSAMRKKMNKWGWGGCALHAHRIVAHIYSQAAKRGFTARAVLARFREASAGEWDASDVVGQPKLAVVGLPRSGTSLMMRILDTWGEPVCGRRYHRLDKLRANPTDDEVWELLQFYMKHNPAGIYEGCDNPAGKVIKAVPGAQTRELALDVPVILMLRDPRKSKASLLHMHAGAVDMAPRINELARVVRVQQNVFPVWFDRVTSNHDVADTILTELLEWLGYLAISETVATGVECIDPNQAHSYVDARLTPAEQKAWDELTVQLEVRPGKALTK